MIKINSIENKKSIIRKLIENYRKLPKNCWNNMVKSAKICYNGNLLTKHKNNLRMFCKIIKSIFPVFESKTIKSSVTISSKNDPINDLNKANSLYKHCSNIGMCLEENSLPLLISD